MGKLRHTVLTLGKCCDTLLTLATLEMHTWPPFIHFFNCMRLTLCMRIPTLLGWPWQALAGQTMDWIVNYGLEHGLEEYGLGCGLECGL